MKKNLVIVESPAKAKTIEKFLGKDYEVLSSFGHIRDLRKKVLSIDVETFEPHYAVPTEKRSLVNDLKAKAKAADTVWLASDEDREGEAIAWHLSEVLKLTPSKTRRIAFHEITKSAILHAIENPRQIDVNLVNAQQARRLLDRIVGFKISPILWRKVKPALSAGRVQSVTLRLIVEREREIRQFQSVPYYHVIATFTPIDGNNENELRAELNRRFATEEEALAFLHQCSQATFSITDVHTRPLKRTPAAPFTTSTLQQEAARKLRLSVTQTMQIAQRLYEAGHITYMRTDSVNLASLAINACQSTVLDNYGERYHKFRQYVTKTKGAQEAHEAIRPTYMAHTTIEGTATEQRLYDLIWKRTLASQMADAEFEKTTVTIGIDDTDAIFVAESETLTFDGFLHVYRESVDEERKTLNNSQTLMPNLQVGQAIACAEVQATEHYPQQPARYAEASLVRKLEELGIGRPSTYAPTISTIQQREYVEEKNQAGTAYDYNILTLKQGAVTRTTKTAVAGAEERKLHPTDIGVIVNDYLMENFPDIMDYNFTAQVEKSFDEVAEGNVVWTDLLKEFYNQFEPTVEQTIKKNSDRRVGERILGNHPTTGKPVSVKIGRFGPMAQIGSASDDEKPRFAQLRNGQSIETVTLEEVLELFKLPRTLENYQEKSVVIGVGRLGPYVHFGETFISLPTAYDPLTITFNDACQVIDSYIAEQENRHIKKFEGTDIEIMNGRYGYYIAADGVNYRLPRTLTAKVKELTLEQCQEVMKAQQERKERKATHKRN